MRGWGGLIVFGLVLIVMGNSINGPQGVTAGWASTEGVVMGHNIDSYSDWSGSNYLAFYCPEVQYTFSVNGVLYKGEWVTPFNDSVVDQSYALGVLARYPIGSTVTVYYDPQDPRYAVLERGGDPLGAYFMIAGVGVMTLAAVAVSYTYARKGKQLSTEDQRKELKMRTLSSITLPLGFVLVSMAGFLSRGNQTLFLLAIGSGIALILITLIYMLPWFLSKFSRVAATSGSTAARENVAPISVGGAVAMVKEYIYEPELPGRLAYHLKAQGWNATPLTKQDLEIAEHRYMGVFSDPVIAAVKVTGHNFDALEIWRMNDNRGGGFYYYFVYVVRGDISKHPDAFDVDLELQMGRNGDLSGITWTGGDLGRHLQSDSTLVEKLIDLGMPNVHIGKPVTGYVAVASNAKLGYVGIQLLPRGGSLRYEGQDLVSSIGWGRDDLPSRQALELAEILAGHVRRLMSRP